MLIILQTDLISFIQLKLFNRPMTTELSVNNGSSQWEALRQRDLTRQIAYPEMRNAILTRKPPFSCEGLNLFRFLLSSIFIYYNITSLTAVVNLQQTLVWPNLGRHCKRRFAAIYLPNDGRCWVFRFESNLIWTFKHVNHGLSALSSTHSEIAPPLFSPAKIHDLRSTCSSWMSQSLTASWTY